MGGNSTWQQVDTSVLWFIALGPPKRGHSYAKVGAVASN